MLLVACGAATVRPDAASLRLVGNITYEARHATPRGASAALETRPARFVDLALLDPSGRILAEGRSDEGGRFVLDAPPGATTLRVSARVRARGHDVSIARDGLGRQTHTLDVTLGEPGEELVVHASDAQEHAGAFHMVDTLLRGLDAVTAWTGVTLPPVYVYWARGGTREWSYYRGERPAGSGRYALELLGGDPGQQSITDTDEHDEAIILHELGHFVMDRLTSDSSTGGMHPRGARIDPGLAWEEGRASWFALAVLGAPLYRDTIGVEPWGSLRVDEDLERGEDPHPGLASETSVAKVLWDLSDGTEGLPDDDDDGLALGPAPVLRAMMALARVAGAYPSLPAFLRFLVTERVVTEEALASMLQRIGEPPELLPRDDEPVWPRTLALGATLRDRVDGLSQPAPGGGPNLPHTGYDAIHTYRLHVTEPGMLLVRLEIAGTGTPVERTDLDLELLDLRADRLADSRGEGPAEAIGFIVQPGFYIVRVRDGGQGNRADYRLRAILETLGGPVFGP